MKKLISLLAASVLVSVVASCGNSQTQVVLPAIQQVNAQDISNQTIGEQQRQQEAFHDFFFKYYSEGQDSYSITSKNEHMQMLIRAENRIDNAKVLLDENADKKVTWAEIKKFVISEPYILDFRKIVAGPSFVKMDANKDKALDSKEFGTFNKEIKSKEVKDYNLASELSKIDYNSSSNLTIEEYENFFIKYLRDKLTWRVK